MKRKMIFIFLIIFVFMGCEEQVLDKPPREAFSEVDVWNDFELVKKFQNSIYEGLESYGVHWILPYAVLCDEAMGAEDLVNSYTINNGNLTPDLPYPFTTIWTVRYKYIRTANIFLEEIESLEVGSAEERNILKGEVKFLRARMYFDLIKLFGGVPLITHVFSLDDNFEVDRTSYEDCVDWIVNELDEAKDLVPLIRTSKEWGRIDKGTCLGTKSQVLLHANSKLHDPNTQPNGLLFDYTKNTWQECADAAKEVIEMPHFELQEVNTWEDYYNIFLYPNSEFIFARVFNQDFSSSRDWLNRWFWPGKLGGSCGIQVFQHTVDAYQMANGKYINDPESGYNPSVETIYKNRDLRFDANLLRHGSIFKGEPYEVVYPDGFEVNQPPRKCLGVQNRKFLDETKGLQEVGGPWPWLRLATIYLNYAEAQFELGNESEAREYINKIRNRVKLPDINSSGEQLLRDIRHERRIELMFENHRFFDVRRWMIAPDTETFTGKGIVWRKEDSNGDLDPNGELTYRLETFQTRTWDNKFYYMPIPTVERERSNLEQNPGYTN